MTAVLPRQGAPSVYWVGQRGEVMADKDRAQFTRRGNLQKYQSRNPVQRFLIWYFHRRVGELVAASGTSAILDVGCGEGFTIDRLASLDSHLPIQGLDYDFPALLQAKEKHPKALFQMGDIGRLPFATDSFELVLCLEVLEHLPERLPWRSYGGYAPALA
jgi:2-polyprenyl-3-methyl-5-hydroxy-6-metoxy-1,4-benzoquinol methylase